MEILENILFEFYRGDTYSRSFVVENWNRTVNNVYFTVKESADNKNFDLQKKLNEGIKVVDETENSITFNLLIDATDTDKLKADTDYSFDIEIHSNGVNGDIIKQTIITGVLRVKASATKTCNER